MLTLFTLSSVSASDLNLTDDDFAGETVNAMPRLSFTLTLRHQAMVTDPSQGRISTLTRIR